jgi:hypothetical protein
MRLMRGFITPWAVILQFGRFFSSPVPPPLSAIMRVVGDQVWDVSVA